MALWGVSVNGSRRWLNLGFGRFQPSELMKVALPLMLAWYFQKFEGRIGWKDFVLAAVLIAVPVYLIKRQPDLGTSLLIAASGFYVLYFAGLSWKVIAGLVAAAGAAAPLIWPHLRDYQRERILTFIDPTRDPLGAGYHSSQASIALGSGGVVGKGWLNGTQTHLDFLPERHTDFIFAVFGEEFGLIGNAVLLVLYLLLIGRGLMITAGASTLFARLIAGATTLMFFTYAFVNMGMVSGVLPVVGVPLPLVSYGGTALISLFIGLGILMSVQAHRKLGQHAVAGRARPEDDAVILGELRRRKARVGAVGRLLDGDQMPDPLERRLRARRAARCRSCASGVMRSPQRTRCEHHVRPAPKAGIRISEPGLTRPSSSASTRETGMRRGRHVAVALHGDVDALHRCADALRHRLDDAQVGLVRNDEVDFAYRVARLGEDVVRGLRHRDHRALEDLLTVEIPARCRPA